MFNKFFILSWGILLPAAALPPEQSAIDYSSHYFNSGSYNQNALENTPQNIVVNNRILLKINGKTITLMDVVRKMDLLFYRQYPELATSTVARYQFYSSAWRPVLGAVIDDYLIVADAEEKEVTIHDGEVRAELEKMFGPDVVINVDELGMTLQEASELLKTELIVQRMTAMMVRSKAMSDVHPNTLRQRYQYYLEENPAKKYWIYQVLSIKGLEHEKIAQILYRESQELGKSIQEVVAAMQSENVEIVYSDEYRQNAEELSLAYKAILESLSVGQTSAPWSNKSASRFFILKGVEEEQPRTFHAFEEELKAALTQEAIERYNQEYRNKLRKHYGLTEKYLKNIIPDHLQPFALR